VEGRLLITPPLLCNRNAHVTGELAGKGTLSCGPGGFLLFRAVRCGGEGLAKNRSGGAGWLLPSREIGLCIQ